MGYNDSNIIEMYKSRGKIIGKLELALANEAECAARNRTSYADSYRVEAKRYVEQLKEMDKQLEHMEQDEKSPVCAYITFEEEEGFERAMVAYPNTSCHRCCQTEKYRIEMPDGQLWRLKVRSAPEPGNILWENLEYDGNSRFCRKVFTTIGTVLLILISFAIILVATTQEKRMNLLYPPVACNQFSDRASGWGISEWRAAVVEDENVGGVVPTNKTVKESLLGCYCQSLLETEVGRTEFYNPSPKWETVRSGEGSESWVEGWRGEARGGGVGVGVGGWNGGMGGKRREEKRREEKRREEKRRVPCSSATLIHAPNPLPFPSLRWTRPSLHTFPTATIGASTGSDPSRSSIR